MTNVPQLAQYSLDRALGLYVKEGITLRHMPRIIYYDKPHPGNADILATCDLEDSASAAHVDFVSKRMGKMIWNQAYGIEVSQEAIDEMTETLKKRFGLSNSVRKASHDILIFPRFAQKVEHMEESDIYMAHELWHFVEYERGVFEGSTLIAEGTATYAAARLLGKRFNDPIESFEDYIKALYIGGANLVQNRVEKERYPFEA